MEVSRAGARGGWLPSGLLAMIALVLAVESAVGRCPRITLDPDDWQYHLARRDAARAARGRDVLFLGDSLIKNGVLPRVVEARSGLKGHNLALYSGQPPATYYLLRRALRAGARPSAVVVDFSPHVLSPTVEVIKYRWPCLLEFPDLLDLCLKGRNARFAGSVLALRCLPTLRGQRTVRASLVAALTGVPRGELEWSRRSVLYWERNGGAQVLASDPRASWDADREQRFFFPADWTPQRVNLDYLHRVLALARDEGLTVYWLIPPVIPALQAAKERSGFEARYLALVRSCLERYPNLVVIDGSRAGYDPGVFHNPTHLGREGAFALSEDLGDLLRTLRAGPPEGRWVALPRYRPRPVDPAIQTVVASGNVPESAPR
jgi:hypothetical protein